MSLADPADVALIVACGLVTYGCRVAGYWIMGHVPIGPRVRRGLEALPGATIVALLAPLVLQAGLPGIAGIVVAVSTMLLLRKDVVAVAAGLAVVVALRAAGL